MATVKPFVDSIYRVLKPGGYFLLRDHDAKNDDLISIVTAAHTVFNAVFAKETPETEANEYRNFQPLSYWIEVLKSVGFKIAKEEFLLQKGDPTLNTLVLFQKPVNIGTQNCRILSEIARKNPEYVRELTQTYQTTPEWMNVLVSKEYAEFQKRDKIYNFPHLKTIFAYWKAFKESFNLARKETGFISTFLSQYTMMDLFIGFVMTTQYLYRSLFSAPLRMTNAKLEAGIEKAFYEMSSDYARFIEHTPFYEYPFMKNVKRYWNAYSNEKKQGILTAMKNIYIGVVLSVGMGIKSILAMPIKLAISGEETAVIQMIIYDPKSEIKKLGSDIVVDKTQGYCKLLTVPRYKKFTNILLEMVKENIKIFEIAGQKKIQLTAKINKKVIARAKKVLNIAYVWNIPSQEKVSYATIIVELSDFKYVLDQLDSLEGDIVYIHDY